MLFPQTKLKCDERRETVETDNNAVQYFEMSSLLRLKFQYGSHVLCAETSLSTFSSEDRGNTDTTRLVAGRNGSTALFPRHDGPHPPPDNLQFSSP